MESLGLQFDYHDCPVCGFEQLFEPFIDDPRGGDDGTDDVDAQRGRDVIRVDLACVGCGTAMFVDPVLIMAGAPSRGGARPELAGTA